MEKYTRICKTCGKAYKYCNRCGEFRDLPTWMIMFHDENCKKIWFAAVDYYSKGKSKDEIKANLLKCDLSNKESFIDKIKFVIDTLFTKSDIESDNTKEVASEENKETEDGTEVVVKKTKTRKLKNVE